jgi:YkoY family integral membrane protein
MFGQTYSPQDLGVVAFLVFLEGLLSIDNALVLALLAKRLPREYRAKALTYGLFGAVLFRVIATGSAAYLLHWSIVKLIGGGYLLWISIRHFMGSGQKEDPAAEADAAQGKVPGFWRTVAVIELTDIAFAVDSILAAIALVGSAPEGHVGPHPKLWVVITGGMLGVLLMRVAAAMFIRLLERFPRFETSAYLLVMVIGGKLLADWGFHLEFQNASSPAFWTFWTLMAICVAVGFLPQKKRAN